MKFKEGQKIVCIDDSPVLGPYGRGKFLKKDNIYTVIGYSSILYGFIFVKEEKKYGWNQERFRPLDLDYDFVEEVLRKIEPKPKEFLYFLRKKND